MKTQFCAVLTAAILVAATSVFARTIAPIVSTDWLEANATDVVILDIRPATTYAEGHIYGAVSAEWSVPFSAWITMSESGLLLEMPADADLIAAIQSMGIDEHSKVVVVGSPNPGEPVYYGPAGAARVALTLTYAGVPNVAILDGGYPKWVTEGKNTTTNVPTVEASEFAGDIDTSLIATINEVDAVNHFDTLVDARDADVYFGATVEQFAPVAGHIPGATSLPGPYAYRIDDDGNVLFRDVETLRQMAEGVTGTNWPFWVPVKYKDIIVYCGVGGYAAIWTYVMREVLGYRHVKFYDGSAQEWVGAGYETNAYIWE